MIIIKIENNIRLTIKDKKISNIFFLKISFYPYFFRKLIHDENQLTNSHCNHNVS
jgi:hypothetical protein